MSGVPFDPVPSGATEGVTVKEMAPTTGGGVKPGHCDWSWTV